jgi:hypothetical protein
MGLRIKGCRDEMIVARAKLYWRHMDRTRKTRTPTILHRLHMAYVPSAFGCWALIGNHQND